MTFRQKFECELYSEGFKTFGLTLTTTHNMDDLCSGKAHFAPLHSVRDKDAAVNAPKVNRSPKQYKERDVSALMEDQVDHSASS